MSTPGSDEVRESPSRPRRWGWIIAILIGLLLLVGILIGLLLFFPGFGSFFSQGGAPTQVAGGHCNQQCDPAAPRCDPGLSCVTEPDGGHVCFGGTDATGETCGGSSGATLTSRPGGGGCNQQCDPNGSTCDAGLSCQREPDGGYVCWGGQDASGQSCGQPPRPTGGACNAPCDPAHPSCDPGLSCVTEPDGGFVCWGGTDASNQACGQAGDGKVRGSGGVCGAQCDPKASKCDAGLSCVQEPDGAFVCWDGKDSKQTVCGQPPATGGLCNSPCDPNRPTCDPGLSCVVEPDGGHVCWGGTDSSRETCGQPRTASGACNQPCDPANPTCDPGLRCVVEPDGGHVCFGGTDSNHETCGQPASTGGGPTVTPKAQVGCECTGVDQVCTKADGTKTVSYNSSECGGTGQCTCRDPNKTLVCPDGTYADFNPICTGAKSNCDCIPNPMCANWPPTSGCPYPYNICKDTGASCKP